LARRLRPCQAGVVTDPLLRHVQPELSEPVLVLAFEGWNDAGEAATHAVSFLGEALGAVPLAELDPEEFYDFTVRRPLLLHEEEGRRSIEWPRNEFRFAAPEAPPVEVVTFVGIEPHLRWRTFTARLVDYAAELGVRRAVLLGSYLADVVYSQPVRVTGFASRSDALARGGADASDYEGPTGIVGVLSEALQRAGLEVTSLWAGLPHYINAAPNPRGALALARAACRALEVEVDDGPLCERAAEFEERISRLVAADPELTEYVKQLKRREFAP